MNNSFITIFSRLDDPRMDRRKLYPLIEIIFLSIAAVVSGANHFTEIQIFGEANLEWLRRFLPFENGIPSHDAIGYFFSRLKPERFREHFIEWIGEVARLSNGEIVAVDGKTLCGSPDEKANKAAVHMVSAWASGAKLVLGQRAVDEKSNEITAIPELLKMLELSGCIVTIDAMGTQIDIAEQIVEGGADYVLALKANHKTLYREVVEYFQDYLERERERERRGSLEPEDPLLSRHSSGDLDHGRLEHRAYWTSGDIGWIEDRKKWKNLSAIGMVRSERTSGGVTSTSERYFLLSRRLSGKQFARAVRTHWEVENCLHWSLDVTFCEDASHIRKGSRPENFAVIRHICLNLIKQESSRKGSIQSKRYRAAMDEKFREKILFHSLF